MFPIKAYFPALLASPLDATQEGDGNSQHCERYDDEFVPRSALPPAGSVFKLLPGRVSSRRNGMMQFDQDFSSHRQQQSQTPMDVISSLLSDMQSSSPDCEEKGHCANSRLSESSSLTPEFEESFSCSLTDSSQHSFTSEDSENAEQLYYSSRFGSRTPKVGTVKIFFY